jgi:hypothetical protein
MMKALLINHMKQWHVKFICLVYIINQYNVLVNLRKLNRLRVSNKKVTCSIFKCIDFIVYSFVLEVLNKGIVCKESIPLLPFKRSIQIIYIV